ncbi:hypothetical protein KIPB_011151 [Kipferlia bialata]|uniref:Nudix hydrolase domain-containing protein n=1 Tax=Kipferlia bialata TaxID=797122 RepID=A0A391NUJ7_9EUKA|nr:hypothetical protein KIPB_011151 [Kipferlia bialata]|eukprot:g11151.t1
MTGAETCTHAVYVIGAKESRRQKSGEWYDCYYAYCSALDGERSPPLELWVSGYWDEDTQGAETKEEIKARRALCTPKDGVTLVRVRGVVQRRPRKTILIGTIIQPPVPATLPVSYSRGRYLFIHDGKRVLLQRNRGSESGKALPYVLSEYVNRGWTLSEGHDSDVHDLVRGLTHLDCTRYLACVTSERAPDIYGFEQARKRIGRTLRTQLRGLFRDTLPLIKSEGEVDVDEHPYDPVGGEPQRGETPLETCLREGKEECGWGRKLIKSVQNVAAFGKVEYVRLGTFSVGSLKVSSDMLNNCIGDPSLRGPEIGAVGVYTYAEAATMCRRCMAEYVLGLGDST